MTASRTTARAFIRLKWLRRGLLLLLFSVGVLAALWAMGMLWHLTIWPAAVRWPLAGLWGLGAVAALVRLPRPVAVTAIGCGVLVVALLASFQRPSLDRQWSPDQDRLPVMTREGDVVRIENLRHAVYRTTDDYDVHWYDDAFDLSTLRRVDLIVESFSLFGGMAHTMLSFGFEDGRQLAVSVEIRKQQGQAYSVLKGLFRQFEVTYVLGDERDLIGLRANVRRNDVRVYPIAASPDQARVLLESMLERAEALSERPEFYHTLHNTCATNLASHLRELNEPTRRWDWRIILPGYSDRLALTRGWIDDEDELSVGELRRRYRINDRSAWTDADTVNWSRQIRQLD